MPLEVGDVAPPFRLRDQAGVERSLAGLEYAEGARTAYRELRS
jgi:hypothetical protein